MEHDLGNRVTGFEVRGGEQLERVLCHSRVDSERAGAR